MNQPTPSESRVFLFCKHLIRVLFMIAGAYSIVLLLYYGFLAYFPPEELASMPDKGDGLIRTYLLFSCTAVVPLVYLANQARRCLTERIVKRFLSSTS